MASLPVMRSFSFVSAILVLAFLSGCCLHELRHGRSTTPTEAGLQTNDLVDPNSQFTSGRAFNQADLNELANRSMQNQQPDGAPPKHSILCLSGGGSYGAYSAGILCGWTSRGDRPSFDVVTGVSTGGLIAPFAFLGPKYDPELERFYTTLSSKDIYKLRPIKGVFSESLADNAPLAREIDKALTCDMMRDLAIAHGEGRRLYLGTTESQGRRFIVWDIGEIASRGRPEDRELIKQVMLGSSAIPGFFPPSEIPVTVDGQPFVEKHVDGGVSYSIFIRPPANQEESTHQPGEKPLAGTDVYAIVAGKLYADPEVVRPWVLSIAAQNVSTLTYSQTRADLVRMWTLCALTGMEFRMTSIPESMVTPATSTKFVPAEMKQLFAEGYDQILEGDAWRSTPPGTEPGEDPLVRSSTNLATFPRSASVAPIQK